MGKRAPWRDAQNYRRAFGSIDHLVAKKCGRNNRLSPMWRQDHSATGLRREQGNQEMFAASDAAELAFAQGFRGAIVQLT
jgi:hypothetical protein